MQIHLDSTDRVTIAGMPGTGKTELARFLAANAYPDVIAYDVLRQFRFLRPIGMAELRTADRQALLGTRYVPRGGPKAREEFDQVAVVLRRVSDLWLLVEECEEFIGQSRPPLTNAYNLMNRSRNWGVGICAVTRRIQELSKTYLELCKYVFLFQCHTNSRDYLERMFGAEAVAALDALPKYHFVAYEVMTRRFTVAMLDLEGTHVEQGAQAHHPVPRHALPG